ncbi:(d)CMP kinase [Streptomyces sp. SID3343]|uniref:(d)CMP kinase n=1 Tax=Streptomyces sp. SID3343 TaxID=2690260 RepID=UPI00136D6486|nr:hypothetical protein [Streptomyces sp. SID3343]
MLSISIDGPTASGKTTLATGLARRFGLVFLDSGLTYRAVAYALGRESVSPKRADLWSVIEHRPGIGPDAGKSDHDGEGRILYRGKDVSDRIWGPEQDDRLKQVASDQSWRSEILHMHREIVDRHRNIVVVGRDVAVTLLPQATLNIYLTASLTVRRERRRAQYRDIRHRSAAVGPATSRDIENRDAIRALAGSVEIESTYLPADAVLNSVVRELRVVAS